MNNNTAIQLPAEWAPQSGIMLTWPHPHSDWAPWLQKVEPVFCDIAFHSARQQKVIISCWDEPHKTHIQTLLNERGCDLGQVILFLVRSNDTWARDHGPITIFSNSTPTLMDFVFNGWGKKYDAELDNKITQALHTQSAFDATQIQSVNLVLEGGSIESDGQGTLMTTSRCLMSPSRNPTHDRPQIEEQLKQLLGIDRILWIEHGHLMGDDTDSHIDTLARFCDAQTICHVSCDDANDPHYDALQAMKLELDVFRTTNNQPYKLIELPLPKAIYNEDGIRLPATYANFLIINNAVLVPVYKDPMDDIALRRLTQCFPDREVIGIDCLPLIYQYGSLHCVTMQLPKGVLN